MADKKISALTSATTPLAGTEVLPIVQSSTTKQVSVANLTAGRSVATGPLTATHTSGAGVTVTRGTKSLELSGNYAGGDVFSAITATTGMDIALLSGGSEILRAVNTGNVNINNGNLVPSTAAKGVNFTANTPAAGMTSQLLNWYEEGTWTPNQGGGLTLVGAFSSTGTYTRIGRQVFICGSVSGATSVAVASAGAISTNLPYSAAADAAGSAINAANNASSILRVSSATLTAATAIAATATITFSAVYSV